MNAFATGRADAPVVVAPAKRAANVYAVGTDDEIRPAFYKYSADLMYAYAVSSKVNSPKNNTPDLLEPVKRRHRDAMRNETKSCPAIRTLIRRKVMP